jgi:hypothetical protein
MLFFLSPRFGKIATGTGPRAPMSIGPIVGGIGLLMLMRVGADPDYVAEALPGILVFGLGLSATVAPLTATALDSVSEQHVGAASGINNGVARVAGLLAIAILGALIAGSFASTLDGKTAGAQLSPQGQEAVAKAKENPFAVPATGNLPAAEARRVETAAAASSEHAFHLGIGFGGVLMIVGGVIAGIGLRNPRRREEREAPRAAPAGECARCAEEGHSGRHHEHDPEPVSA